MKNKLKKLFILAALLLTTGVYCQTDKKCKLVSDKIKGTYNGKNLMFQNNSVNGIQQIWLNGRELVSNINSTAFELPLDQCKKGHTFELKIVYCDVKPPPFKILNPEVIK